MGVDADIDRVGRALVTGCIPLRPRPAGADRAQTTTTTTQKPLEVHELDRRLAGRAMDGRMEKISERLETDEPRTRILKIQDEQNPSEIRERNSVESRDRQVSVTVAARDGDREMSKDDASCALPFYFPPHHAAACSAPGPGSDL